LERLRGRRSWHGSPGLRRQGGCRRQAEGRRAIDAQIVRLLGDLLVHTLTGKAQAKQAAENHTGRDHQPACKIVKTNGFQPRLDHMRRLFRGNLKCTPSGWTQGKSGSSFSLASDRQVPGYS